MKHRILLKLSIISLFTFSVSTFDFFLFNRFYADGQCKTKQDLSKYVIEGQTTTQTVQDNIRNLKRDEMITIKLLRQDSEPIKFGIIFSDSKKKSLWSAHEFFKIIEQSADEHEKAIFPDLISCVIDTSFIYSFGLMDSYGLLYALSPTMHEYRTSQINMNAYNFLDLINIFMDIIRSMKVVVRHNFYLKKFNELDIGIAQIVNGPNVRIQGKLRRLHKIRKANLCKPETMRSYQQIYNSYVRFNNIEKFTKNIDLSTFESCQNVNLIDIWQLFIEKYTINYAVRTGVTIDFADCVSGVASDCPDEFEFLWINQEYKNTLMNFTRTALRYKTMSIIDFLINLLENVKNHYLRKKVIFNLDIINSKIEQKTKMFQKITHEQNEILGLDMNIFALVPGDKKNEANEFLKNKKEEIKQEIINGDNESKQEIAALKKVMEDPMRDVGVVEEVKRLVNKDKIQEFDNLENKKEELVKLEFEQIHEMEIKLMAKKAEVRNQYLEIEQASLQKAAEMSKDMKIYQYELQLIELVKQSNGKSFVDVMKENPQLALKVKEEWAKRGINFDLENDQEKASIESADEVNIAEEHSHDDSESSVTASESSSEEELSVDYMRQQNLLGVKIYDAFKRDELEIDQSLTMDFDEDVNHFNFDLIAEMKQETNSGFAQDFIKSNFNVDVSREGIQQDGKEENVLANYQKAIEADNALALKHSLKSNILREASLKLEVEEKRKLMEIGKILEAKEKILAMKNEGLAHEMEIIALEATIQSKTAGLIRLFGELDDVGVLGDGVKRMSISDVRDDYSVFQLEQVQSLSHLEQMDEVRRLII